MRYSVFESPIGLLFLTGDGQAPSSVYFKDSTKALTPDPTWVQDDGAFRQAISQLEAYFAGKRRMFELELAPRGTPFQQRVWSALQTIPYGVTTTYGHLAAELGDPKATRAVGLANGRNP